MAKQWGRSHVHGGRNVGVFTRVGLSVTMVKAKG
jgi:hypothetical protein